MFDEVRSPAFYIGALLSGAAFSAVIMCGMVIGAAGVFV